MDPILTRTLEHKRAPKDEKTSIIGLHKPTIQTEIKFLHDEFESITEFGNETKLNVTPKMIEPDKVGSIKNKFSSIKKILN